MTRAKAIEKVEKLRALAAAASGGTPAERALAGNMAEATMRIHGLTEHDLAHPNECYPMEIPPGSVVISSPVGVFVMEPKEPGWRVYGRLDPFAEATTDSNTSTGAWR